MPHSVSDAAHLLISQISYLSLTLIIPHLTPEMILKSIILPQYSNSAVLKFFFSFVLFLSLCVYAYVDYVAHILKLTMIFFSLCLEYWYLKNAGEIVFMVCIICLIICCGYFDKLIVIIISYVSEFFQHTCLCVPFMYGV